jgi:hypothetical protein
MNLIPFFGRSSVSAYLKDWNTSVIGIGSPAHKLKEFRDKFRDKHGQTHAIPMAYHPMSDQTTHATA